MIAERLEALEKQLGELEQMHGQAMKQAQLLGARIQYTRGAIAALREIESADAKETADKSTVPGGGLG